MKIVIFGGDGFCGWPTSLHLSNLGHEIFIVDNLSRRKIDIELETNSLTPIKSTSKRLETWRQITGNKIKYANFDLSSNYSQLLSLLKDFKPDTVVHFAEQRAAPYSMKGSFEKRYTVNNNLNATNNLLAAIVESKLDIHVVHLGTMGVYGYGNLNMKIPEGYLKINIANEDGNLVEKEILYPANPGSIYHLTKTQDALMFNFYNRNDKLRITDLHQGIVWGTQTLETSMHSDLINRYDYDGDFGTVLNRFIMQAAIGHPLTVYGSGGQTRAFIHILDSITCINLALKNPPKKGEKVKIFNQISETHTIIDLAKLVSKLTGAEIKFYDNPRNEADSNRLHAENKCFLDLGFKPTYLNDNLISEIEDIAKKYQDNCIKERVISTSFWNA
jgi:UDP-sulfoquinovose synthase